MARKMKESSEYWIGSLPFHWNEIKVKYIAEIGSGTGIAREEFVTNGLYPVIGANGEIGRVNKTNNSQRVLTTGRVGTIGTVHRTNNAWISDNALIIKFDQANIDEDFLFYAMPNFDYSQMTSGTAMPLITATKLLNQTIPYPDMDEQNRIASFLDQQCANIDTVLQKTRESIEEYKKLKQAVITQAVTKGIRPGRKMRDSGIEWIGEIPEEWDIIRIKWLLNERKEKSILGTEEPLSMSQKYGIIPTRQMDSIPNMAASFVGAKITYKGDLVFNKLKAHLGVFSVSQYDGLVSPDYAVYFPSELSDAKYLEYLFKTPHYINEFKKKSSGVGAGLTRLYTGDLFTIPCAIPSVQEQKSISEYIQNRCTEIDYLVQKKEALIRELESYRKSLIYEYVTGKKEVPSDGN